MYDCMDAAFLEAFNAVLGHEIDRAILVELRRAGRELGHEELRRRVGSPHSQTFQYALDRMMDHALVGRRLEPWGERYRSHLSPTSRGTAVARVLDGLASRGAVPEDLLDEVGEELRRAFVGGSPA